MRPTLAVLVAASLFVGGCGGGSGLTTSKMEDTIKPDLQKQLRDRADDPSIRVLSVDCVKQSKSDATCAATFSSGSDGDRRVSLSVAIDPDTDAAIWRVQ